MADAAKVPAQHIVRLVKGRGDRGKDFVELRRPYDKKGVTQWIRDAHSGKIPGAFQFGGKGPLFVNLDVYDAEVQKLSAPKTVAPDDALQQLAATLGISEKEMQIVRRAAGL
jgi:predicted esterase